VPRTMVVEDNLSFRQVVKGELSSQFPSMEVIDVGNGEEALKCLASYPMDLVFMDIGLPGENGLELTKRIKTDYQDVTVAILTSYDGDEYREAAARCGADCYIVKGSMKWDQISTFVKCFQQARDGGRLKPSCVRIASESERSYALLK